MKDMCGKNNYKMRGNIVNQMSSIPDIKNKNYQHIFLENAMYKT